MASTLVKVDALISIFTPETLLCRLGDKVMQIEGKIYSNFRKIETQIMNQRHQANDYLQLLEEARRNSSNSDDEIYLNKLYKTIFTIWIFP